MLWLCKGKDSFKELNGAGNGARTRDIKLGKLALYQLSYARIVYNIKGFETLNQYFSAFPVIAESLFKNRGYEVVNRCMVIGNNNRIPFANEFLHEVFRHNC